jgi:hypothetical protein
MILRTNFESAVHVFDGPAPLAPYTSLPARSIVVDVCEALENWKRRDV